MLHAIFIGERCDAHYGRYPNEVNEWWFDIFDSFTVPAIIISVFMFGFSSGIHYKQETIDSILLKQTLI